MNIWKKLTALFLSAACVCALVCVPPASAAGAVSTFPDITDPQVGRAVEALRIMGVVSGSGGSYKPDGSLTRAEFCKMAILVMGKGDEADAQASRTIFNDVSASHWARGYVNLAAQITVGAGEDGKGGSRLMMGMGDGTFAPDKPTTYAQAVTILLRILGYTKQANANWPTGAVATAASIGLDSGFTPPKAGDTITRAQAALLFCNMLTAPMEGGGKDSTYLQDYLSCTPEKGALLLVNNGATQSGQTGAVKVFAAEGKHNGEAVAAAVNTPAAFLVGARGTAVFDKAGKFFTFLPDAASSSKTITIASISGGVLTAGDGSKYTPSNNTNVWNGKTDEPDTYSYALTSLRPGTSVTLCFNEAGAIDYLFVHGTGMSLSGGTMVARDKVGGNPFAQLTGGTVDYKIVKNGAEVTSSALKQYDVAAFDPTNKTLYVTDFRLTGVYESASPNTAMPTSVKVMGFDLPVLDSAVEDLKNLKLGSTVTLLLSPDGKVAGAVSSSTLRSNTVGYVDSNSKIQLLNAPSGLSELSPADKNFDAAKYADCLVTVTGGKGDTLYVSRVSERTSSAALDVNRRTLGGTPLADNVAVFDRIANSGIKQVSLANVTVASVPASKIVYQRTNADGKIDLLVLNDVTGDLYTYGICKNGWTNPPKEDDGSPEPPKESPSDNPSTSSFDTPNNRITKVYNTKCPSGESGAIQVVGGTSYNDGQFIGLAASVSKLDTLNRHAASVALKSVEKVSPNNFNLTTNRFFSGSIELPISDEVQCYNAQTKTWFGAHSAQSSAAAETPSGETPSSGTSAMDNLRACLAYSSNLTVWYDRDPAQGGKVRVVVAN